MTDGTNRWILTGAGTSILILNRFDRRVQAFSQERGLLPDDLSHVLDLYGGGVAYPAALALVGTVSCLQGDGWTGGVRKLKYVWTSMAFTATVTGAMKTLSRRERPNGKGFRSFPSGHTSGSFVVAATLNVLYGRSIGIPAYAVAGLVGVSRIHDNKHWLTDVIAGASIGTVIGRAFGLAYRNETNDPLVTVSFDQKNAVYLRVTLQIN
ncbi:MAG: phosphatase PAP2 family protein [Fidelibacterota bacterium]